MTAARQVLPGQTYFITRRCSDRRFFLVPSRVVNGIFLYCLAVAAALTKVQIHAVCVMSNHIHIVLTDPEGVLPKFMAWLNRHSAICLKILRKRSGPIWEAGEKYSAVALLTPTAVYRKLVYTVTNPVKAGLVRTHREWPGLCLGAEQWEQSLPTEQPSMFFRKRKKAPPVVRLVPPPMLEDWDQERLVRSLVDAVEHREERIRRDIRRQGKGIMGPGAVCRQRPYDRPAKNNPPGTRNPVFSAVTPAAIRKAAASLRSWRERYRHCFEQVRAGVRDVEFPAGTWWMVQYAGARAAPA